MHTTDVRLSPDERFRHEVVVPCIGEVAVILGAAVLRPRSRGSLRPQSPTRRSRYGDGARTFLYGQAAPENLRIPPRNPLAFP